MKQEMEDFGATDGQNGPRGTGAAAANTKVSGGTGGHDESDDAQGDEVPALRPTPRSIKTLLTSLLLVLTLPLAGFLVFSQVRHFRSDLQTERERLMDEAEAATMGIRQFVDDTRYILQGMAEDPDLASMDPRRCPEWVAALGDLFIPTYTNLFTWTLQGDPVCSAKPFEPGWRPETMPPGIDETMAAEEFHVGRVHRGVQSQLWTVGLSYPLRNDAGERVGIVVLAVDMVRFQRILEDLDLPEHGIVTVLETSDLTVVARSQDAEEMVGLSPETTRTTGMDDPTVQQRGFSRATTPDGQDYLWGFMEIPEAGWMVYAGVPARAVYGPLTTSVLWALLFTLLVFALVALLGVRVYRQIAGPLVRLAEGAARAGSGEVTPLQPEGPREIADLARRFNQAWASRAHAQAEREHSRDRLRALAARLEEIRENERTALARELHDEVGQALTTVGMDLTLLADDLVEHPEKVQGHLRELRDSLDEATRLTQDISARLRPPALDLLGLEEAIRWQAEQLQTRAPVELRLDLPENGSHLERDVAVAVFRVFQEALTNVFRHSEASAATIRLDYPDSTLRLQVEDDGKGIEEDRIWAMASLGLTGMRERALALGGELKVERGPEGGTRVTLTVPLEKPERTGS